MRLLLFFLLSWFSTVAYGQGANQYSIHITVMDSATQQPLDLVSIRCMPGHLQALTNKAGQATFFPLELGTYKLTFSHLGCPDVVKTVELLQSASIRVVMSHQIYQLSEVQIQPLLPQSPIVNQLDRNNINNQSGKSLGELLSTLPGITLQQTGVGIQKPVINGLTDSRIIYVNRGARLESQQWGQDHAPEIDPAQAGRIKLVIPARSFRMGADAIGAMVELLPEPFPQEGKRKVEVGSAYMSNNRLWNGFLSIAGNEAALAGLQWRLSWSGRKAGNTSTPGYWLYNTGFQDNSLTVETKIPLKRGWIETDGSWFQSTSGIFLGSQIGNVTDLLLAIQRPKPLFNKDEFSYEIDRPRQEVNHLTGRFRYLSAQEDQRHWQVQLTAQQNRRKEFDLARISENPELDLTLTSFQLYGEWHSGKQFSTGLAGNFRENTWSGSRFFIPNYRQLNPGWYANWRKQWGKFVWYSGVRLDYHFLETFRNQNGRLFSDQRNWFSAAASMQLVMQEQQGNSQQFEWSILWRPPQVNELFVNGLHHGTSSFERGDAGLKQEGGIRVSWRLERSYCANRIGFQQQIFSQFLPGFIYARPDGVPVLTIRGAFPSFSFTQTNAWLNGGNWMFFVEPIRNFTVEARFQTVLAFDVSAQTWLAPMPADRAEFNFKKRFEMNFWKKAGAQSGFALIGFTRLFKQNRLPEINTDYLLPPEAVLLTRFEVGGNWKLKNQNFVVSLSINNLFNQVYRDYLNRFRYFSDEAGLNMALRIRYFLNT